MGLLTETAIVYRRQQVEGSYKVDRFGQPTRDEEPHHILACRITAARGGEQFTDRTHDVVEATHRLFLDKGADLSEQDVVTVVDATVDEVQGPFEEDPSTAAEGFNEIVSRARVLLAKRAHDGSSEHHREAKLAVQRETAEAS